MNKIITKILTLVIASGIYLTSFAGGASTEDGFSQTEDDWHFMVAPYIWMSQMSGNVTVLGNERYVDVPFSKIFTNLDFAFQGHFEVGKGPWTLMLDPSYIKVSKDSSGVGITTQLGLIDTGVYYRFFSKYLPADRYIALELMGGARYFGGNVKLSIPGNGLGENVWVIAPMLGARLKYLFTPKARLWLEGDVGGFDVDDVSNTWSAMFGISYQVYRSINVAVAYKLLKINYTKPKSGFDTLMYGPMVGVVFHWP